jgi:DNA-binding LacI/PurR family transcriptional regulator
MDRKLTSQDIARLAGVSQTAVSLVLRGRWQGRVGQDTAARIQRIAEEKNYRVNRAASLLKTGKTNTIAVVVPDSENPFFSRILHALRVRTIKLGFECMLVETAGSSTWYDYIENSILGGEIARAVNLYNNRIDINPAIADRVITVNDVFASTSSVLIDYNWAINEAVRLLREKGYTNLLQITPDPSRRVLSTRTDAFRKASEEEKIRHSNLYAEGHVRNNIYELLREHSKELEYPLGMILDDDLYAQGVYAFARDNDLIIGKDIGVISMNDTFVCPCLQPYLSSFGFDDDLLVSRILEMLEGGTESGFRKEKILMRLNDGKSY